MTTGEQQQQSVEPAHDAGVVVSEDGSEPLASPESTNNFRRFCLLTLVLVMALPFTMRHSPDAAMWVLFGGEEDEADLFHEKKQKETGPPPTRVLYILTSSSNNKGGDRFQKILIPVLQRGVGSFYQNDADRSSNDNDNDNDSHDQNRRYHVDVYLILSYQLEDEHFQAIRSALPRSVGLQVWNDALPLDYVGCDRNLDKTPFDQYNATLCEEKPIVKVSHVRVALARQHRYVMKDKFPYYDVFISLEDDMRVMRHHVETHFRTMEHVRNSMKNMTKGALTSRHLERVRPGFVRVEVLQSETSERRVRSIEHSPNQIANSIPLDKEAEPIHTGLCCGGAGPNATTPGLNSVIAWETAIESLGVIEIGKKWYAVIPGTREKALPDHWAGNIAKDKVTNSTFNRPDPFDARFLAQPASWIMTRSELMQAHTQLCHGGFLPPYEAPTFYRNGLWRNNVEFWSGGIQMWCGTCNIVRVMELDQFSSHLVYHSTNNKQYDIRPEERLVRMNEMYAQLLTIVADAKKKQSKAAIVE